jgi:hypothetical protein
LAGASRLNLRQLALGEEGEVQLAAAAIEALQVQETGAGATTKERAHKVLHARRPGQAAACHGVERLQQIARQVRSHEIEYRAYA